MKVLSNEQCAHWTIFQITSQKQIAAQSRGHQLLGICYVSSPKLLATVNLLCPKCLISKLSHHEGACGVTCLSMLSLAQTKCFSMGNA